MNDSNAIQDAGAAESGTRRRLDHVARCIEIVRGGGMIIMTDDEDRENEGDLVIAAEHCNAEAVNFMAKEGRGLICLSLTPERVDHLGLAMMVPTAPGSMGTAFTVSIEAREGVTTGISAADRARTIAVASDDACSARDLVSPGHVFPLRAQRGGVLVRSGHTEGSVDIARLAGCRPAGVICEIIRDDGEMARMDDLEGFAERHGLEILTIADLIEYRLNNEMLVERLARRPFASKSLGISEADGWSVHAFRASVSPGAQFLAFCKGPVDADADTPVLLRAQRAQVLGDVFGFDADDSSRRLRAAFEQIDRAGRGVFLYVLGDHLGDAGLGELRELEATTGSADAEGVGGPGAPGLRPRESGFREFGLGAQVLRALGVRRIEVMTNNPRKIIGVEGFGIEVAGSVPLEGA